MVKFFTLLSSLILLLAASGCNTLLLPTLAPTIALPQNTPAGASPEAPTAAPAGATPTPESSATPDPSAPLWIANPADQMILGIDPLSGEIIRRIAVDGSPELVVSAAGAVWALDRTNDRLLRIDPLKQRVAAYIFLPKMQAEDLAAGADMLWVGANGELDVSQALPGETDFSAPGYILRIDPATNVIAEQIPSGPPVYQIEIDGSILWILARTAIDTPLLRMSTVTRKVEVVEVKNAPEWFLMDALTARGDVWLFSLAYGKLFRAAPEPGLPSLRLVAAYDLEMRQPSGYPDLLLTGSGLWAATPWGTVLHIDAGSAQLLGQIELERPLTTLIKTEQGPLWALSQQTGALFELDPATHQVIAQVNTGSAQQPTVVPSPTPRVVIWEPCPGSPTSRLQIGATAYVNKEPPVPNRVRKEPNRSAEMVGWIAPGASMKIVEGPVCADEWIWWRVETGDLNGWTAEGDKESYWLVPLYP